MRGRVVVVTGAARGIGLHIAGAMAQAGASIVIAARQMAAIEAAYGQLAGIPGVEVLGWAADVRRYEEVEALAEQAVARFGRIDAWVNGAGISGPSAHTADVSPERWREVVETNLAGAFHGTHVALRHMLPRNQGKIINLLGVAFEGQRPQPLPSAYASATEGVLRFTQTVAEEYRETGLSILALSPGMGRTEPAEKPEVLAEADLAQLEPTDWVLETLGPPLQEVAAMAVRLASSETDGVTGKVYEVGSSRPGGLRGLLWRPK